MAERNLVGLARDMEIHRLAVAQIQHVERVGKSWNATSAERARVHAEALGIVAEGFISVSETPKQAEELLEALLQQVRIDAKKAALRRRS